MPLPMIRNGNAFVEEVQYTLSHGSAAQSFECKCVRPVVTAQGNFMEFLLSGSNYFGLVTDVQLCIDEQGGRYSLIRGVDRRDELFSRVVFAKLNIIDESDGSIYSEIEPENPLDDLLNLDGKIFAWEILDWLSFTAGFENNYSSNTQDVLDAESVQDWRDSRYNVFNIDWSSGIKVGPALDQICELLGIQFTLIDGRNKILRFSVRGRADLEDIQWNHGAGAVRSRIGSSVQPDVDTGIYIVGDKDVYQYNGVRLIPAWDRTDFLWDAYKLVPGLLDKDLSDLGFNRLYTKVGEFIGDPGFLDGRFFNDMTIDNYMKTVPLKVFRIEGMENYLVDVELDGTAHVRNPPISDHLVTDTRIEAKVYCHPYNLDTKNRSVPIESYADRVDITDGFKIYKDTGHVVFDQERLKITTAAKARMEAVGASAVDKQLLAGDVEPDDMLIDVAFLGRNFREFFGVGNRIGSHQVSGLHRSYTIDGETQVGDTTNAVEQFVDGEKHPDWIAEDVAVSLLSRQRTVISGEAEFRGIAGHIPTGEIQRVSVSLNGAGLTEVVSYANDEYSPEYEPQIELRRKIANDREIKRLDRVKQDIEGGKLKVLIQKAQGKGKFERTERDLLINQSLDQLNKDNWVMVQNEAVITTEFGEPIVADSVDGRFNVVHPDDADDEDGRVIGLALSVGSGNVPVVTIGIANARVMGPVVVTDQLSYDNVNRCLKKAGSAGGSIIAMKDQALSSISVIPVKLGGGGGGAGGAEIVRTASISNLTLSGTYTHDGIALVADDTLLVKDQTTVADNGVYTVKSTAWVKSGQPDMVLIKEGSNANTQWYLKEANYYEQLTEMLVVRAVSSTAVSTSGSATIDGVAALNNALYLLRGQSTQSERGVWKMNTGGAWTKIGQPMFVCVVSGTLNGGCAFFKSAANTYTHLGSFYK